MSVKNKLDILWQKYLKGGFSPRQQGEVEAMMAYDHDWKAAQNAGAASSVSTNKRNARSAYSADKKSKPANLVVKKNNILKVLRVITAVSALLFFLFISWKAYEFYHLTPEKIYQQTFLVYPKSMVENRFIIIESIPIKEAYIKKDFKRVVQQSKKISSLSQTDTLLVALSYLQTAEPATAIKWLEHIAKTPNQLQQDAAFYLTLAYLNNKDYDKCIDLMQQIVKDPNHLYKQQFTSKNVQQVKMVKWK